MSDQANAELLRRLDRIMASLTEMRTAILNRLDEVQKALGGGKP